MHNFYRGLHGTKLQEQLCRDREAAARLAKLTKRRQPRKPGTGPHVIDPSA